MNIIIAGGGKVGINLARQLSAEGYDITIIDSDQRVLNTSMEKMDVMAVYGNCASMNTLLQAGVKEAELLIAATNADEVNLLCCTAAHGINPKIHTIARIRNPEYTEQIFAMRDTFGLSMDFNPEKQAAAEIQQLLKYPGFLRRDSFAKGRAEIVELRIDAKSKLCNATLMELPNIVKTKVLVCAVLRDGNALVSNSGSFTLREGDRVFVTAPTENLTILLKNLQIITRRARNVMLCGGGRVSYYLADLLAKDGISAKIIESSANRCRELAIALPETNIVQGDATDQDLLENEGLGSCDALVTLTGMDELNMIVSLFGSTRRVPQVITKLSHSENHRMLIPWLWAALCAPRKFAAAVSSDMSGPCATRWARRYPCIPLPTARPRQ